MTYPGPTSPMSSNPAAAGGSALHRLVQKPGRLLALATLASLAFLMAIVFRPALPDPKLANAIRITRSQSRILSPILMHGAHLYYQEFDNGRYKMAEVMAKGGESAAQALGVANPELCDITPDGSLLVRDLVHSREDNEPVYIQPLVGGTVRRVGDILAFDAAWFPDGRHILYATNGAVYRSDLEGASSRHLFNAPGKAYWFRWSPDGRRLRFTILDPRQEAASLWEAPADGGEPTRLFPGWTDQQCCGSWMSDGRYFVFQVRVEIGYQIWARREKPSGFFTANAKPVPLATGPINYRGPLPSRDGRKLFMRAEIPKGELVRYDQKSGQYIPLLPSIQARTAAFSRDGMWIAYTGLVDNSLWRCRSDGSRCLQLTNGMQQTMMMRSRYSVSWRISGSTWCKLSGSCGWRSR